MEWYDLAEELLPALKKGDLEACIGRVSNELSKLSKSPFSKVMELDFSNNPKDIADCFQSILNKYGKKIDIKALYTETNGFDINPDEWYFDIFGYSAYDGLKDLDWLSDWQVESENGWVLTGMEALQEVYASDAYGNPEFDKAREFVSLLVVLKFQKLIRNSLALVPGFPVPVLATSHDYDFIYEYRKNG
jgi:hypothetical protein